MFIEASNSRNRTFTLGMNHFGDLTPSEFRSLYVSGLKLNKTEFVQMSRGKLFVPKNAAAPSDSWDWRNKGAVTAVFDQKI